MKNWRLPILAVFVCLLFVSLRASAHHGTAAYETTKLTTFKGTATQFKFINPHVEITVEAKDDKGKIEQWLGEANSPNVLSRHGWSKEIIKPGDQITVFGTIANDSDLVPRLDYF